MEVVATPTILVALRLVTRVLYGLQLITRVSKWQLQLHTHAFMVITINNMCFYGHCS